MRTILSLIFLLSLVACNSILDDVAPVDSLPIEEAFDSIKDLEAAVTGAYDLLQSPDLAGRNLIMFPDLLGGNLNPENSNPRQIAIRDIQTDNSYVSGYWIRSYQAINQLNLILKSLNQVANTTQSADPATLDLLEGEALFLRGLLYFEMVRYFGLPFGLDSEEKPGVPLILDPITSLDNLIFPARASVADVYRQVEADFAEAFTLLPEFNPNGRGRANQMVIIAYQARVAFQQEAYEAAGDLCDIIMTSGKYALTNAPVDFFVNEGSAEEIFVSINTAGDNPFFQGLTGNLHPVIGVAEISESMRSEGYPEIITEQQRVIVSDTFPNALAVDLRSYEGAIANPPLTADSLLYTFKYEDDANRGDDAPLARLAEFILMRAEIYARNGETEPALNLLNQIRQRALRAVDQNDRDVLNANRLLTYSPDDFANTEELLTAIYAERRVELAFEGNLFHDLMRRKESIGDMDYDADKLRFPIPQREIDVNPNLIQNPGYQ